MGNFGKNTQAGIIYDIDQFSLGTLANKDAIQKQSKIDANKENGFRILRSEWKATLGGIAASEGPILFGFAAGSLTAQQIEDCLESDPQKQYVPDVTEESMRPVWPLALFFKSASGDGHVNAEGVAKFNWSIPEGDFASWWAYHMGSGTLTTGATMSYAVKHFGVWLKD